MTKQKSKGTPSKPLIEYDIFVPTVDPRGQKVKKKIILECREKLIEFFGGLTDTRYRNSGFWKVGSVTVRDEIVIWRVVSEKGKQGDSYIKKMRESLESSLKQDRILVIRRRVDTV